MAIAMSITEFIQEMNKIRPSVNMIMTKYQLVDREFDLTKARVYLDKNTLTERALAKEKYDDVVDELIYETNISSISVGGLNFYSEIHFVDNMYKEFASYNDFYRISFSTLNKTVISYDQENGASEKISGTFDEFLLFLIEYERYHKNLVFSVPYSPSESYHILKGLVERGFSSEWIDILIPTWKNFDK